MRWFILLFVIIVALIAGCEEDSAGPGFPPPSAPTDLKAVPESDSRVKLAWIDSGPLEGGYNIERSSLAGFDDWNVVAVLEMDTETYIDTGLTEGTTYRYRVTAFHIDVYSEPSGTVEVTTLPVAPCNLTVIAVSVETIDIIWRDSSEVETGFEVQRMHGDNETVVVLPENTVEYHDQDLISRGKYYYRVRAMMDSFGSLWSNRVYAIAIPAPFDLYASIQPDGSVRLGWRDSGSGETGFSIERHHVGSGGWSELDTLDEGINTYTDLYVNEGNVYQYRVRALFETARSSASDSVEVRTPPFAPDSLHAIQDQEADTAAYLYWSDVSSVETGFELQRKMRFQSHFASISEIDANDTSFHDTGLLPNTTYIYRIRALLDTLTSHWSDTASVYTELLTPLRPTDLAAEALAPRRVELSWSDNSDNEQGFGIERRTTLSEWEIIDSTCANEREVCRHIDISVESRTTYYYRVFGYNRFGNSRFSNEAEVTTPQPVPNRPTNLQATEVTFRSVTMEWQDNSEDELGFRLERSLSLWEIWDYTRIIDANVTSHTDTTVEMETEYAYRVLAFNEAGESECSEELPVFVPNGPPGTPQYLHAQPISSEEVNLTWSRSTDNELGYRIERREFEGEFGLLASTGSGIVTYQDTGVEPETWYWYRVLAYNEIGESGYSNVDSAFTPKRTIFKDGFEDYSIGEQPSGENWESDSRGSSFLFVTDINAHEGEKSVRFLDRSDDDSSCCLLRLDHTPVRAGTFECWLQIAPEGNFGIDGGDNSGNITFQLQFNDDNTFQARDGDVMQSYDGYPTGEWFHLMIVFSTDTRLYSIYIDEDAVAEDILLMLPDHQVNSRIAFRTFPDRTLSTGYLDDVCIFEDD